MPTAPQGGAHSTPIGYISNHMLQANLLRCKGFCLWQALQPGAPTTPPGGGAPTAPQGVAHSTPFEDYNLTYSPQGVPTFPQGGAHSTSRGGPTAPQLGGPHSTPMGVPTAPQGSTHSTSRGGPQHPRGVPTAPQGGPTAPHGGAHNTPRGGPRAPQIRALRA